MPLESILKTSLKRSVNGVSIATATLVVGGYSAATFYLMHNFPGFSEMFVPFHLLKSYYFWFITGGGSLGLGFLWAALKRRTSSPVFNFEIYDTEIGRDARVEFNKDKD